jgi:hypothetical protein
MDGERLAGRSQRTGPAPDARQLTDAALDREIMALLASEPSPEFLARVRARVAEEPAPRTWRAAWMFAAAGAAAAVIVAVIAWPSAEPAGSHSTPVQTLPQVADLVKPPLPERVEPPTVRRDIRPRVARAVAATPVVTATARQRDLVPVVAVEDARAFDALLATLRDRNVMLVFEDVPDSTLSASALAIEPIAIDPQPTNLEGGVE